MITPDALAKMNAGWHPAWQKVGVRVSYTSSRGTVTGTIVKLDDEVEWVLVDWDGDIKKDRYYNHPYTASTLRRA